MITEDAIGATLSLEYLPVGGGGALDITPAPETSLKSTVSEGTTGPVLYGEVVYCYHTVRGVTSRGDE